MATLIFDTECYADYWLIAFLNVATGKSAYFEQHDEQKLDVDKVKQIVSKNLIIGFNSLNYDMPMLTYALQGANNQQLKKLSDYIIVGGYKYWQCETAFKFKISQKIDHIDLIEVANGKGSLKQYGARLHSKKIQDLPIKPEDLILPNQRESMREYCGNDLQTTCDLYNKLLPQIELRCQMSKLYGIDLRSKSDAQIAEHVIKNEVEKAKHCKLQKANKMPKPFKYKKPDFIAFQTPILQQLLEDILKINFVVIDSGKVVMPKEISDRQVKIGEGSYTLGIGGLHSNESCVTYRTNG